MTQTGLASSTATGDIVCAIGRDSARIDNGDVMETQATMALNEVDFVAISSF